MSTQRICEMNLTKLVIIYLAVVCIIMTSQALGQSPYVYPDDTTFMKTYIKEKPRFILTPARLQELKTLYAQDTVLKKYVDLVITYTPLTDSLPVYSSATGGLLNESYRIVSLVTRLSFLYLWTGDTVYAERAKQVLLTIANFPDWDEKWFLDTAEMGTAVSFGLDWLSDYFKADTTSRNHIKDALINHCLKPGKDWLTINSSASGWTTVADNANFICNSSLIIASLAVAEWDRQYADTIIPLSLNSLSYALNACSPDGAWHEGPAYLRISMDIYSLCCSSLMTSLNNTFDLMNTAVYPGIDRTDYFYLSLVGRCGYFLCYSDILSKCPRQNTPNIFFFGTVFNDDRIIANEQNDIKNKWAAREQTAFYSVWYKHVNAYVAQHSNKFFRGLAPLFIVDNDTYGANSIYLAAKAGSKVLSHAHYDMGNFEFDALGQRWARDLGSDNYSIPNYGYCYRVSAFSHNVPIINNSNQPNNASASFLGYSLQTDSPWAIIDLTDSYSDYVTQLIRGIKLIDSNRTILVQDEYSLKASQECYWGMTTDATPEIIDSKTAKLTQNGKELYAKIISPDNCFFSTSSAYQDSIQNPNTGVSRLYATKHKDSTLNFTMLIQLSPNWNGYISPNAEVIPLNQWTSVDELTIITPSQFTLYQNYPNPFNPSTEISYQVPGVSNVTLKVYDILGREVATLVNEVKHAGVYTTRWNAISFASGIYFYRLQVGVFSKTKKLILLK